MEPLLILIFVNDMPLAVKGAACRLYADDTLLGMDVTECGSAGIQENISALYEWSVKWGMTFNPAKCVHMEVGREIPSFTLQLNGTIPQSNSVKYLGVHIENNFKWHEHISIITKKANKALGLIRRTLFNTNCRTKLIAYNAVVRPILEYACQVWSPYNKSSIDMLETIQRRAIRWIFRLGQLDSVTECMESNNISTLEVRRQELDQNFIKRLEFGLYDLDINDYVSFNQTYCTRNGTIAPHFRLNQFKFSFYNRTRVLLDGKAPSPS